MLTKQSFHELIEKHDVDRSLFLVGSAPWLTVALFEPHLRFQTVTHGNQNAAERLLKELKRRIDCLATHFGHATADSAETWPQTSAYIWNQLI